MQKRVIVVIKKVIITSGKVFYDLTKFRSNNGNQNTAIIRIEQFYPFKEDSLKNILMSYPKSEKIVWVQEEPKNMGGWNFISNRISNLVSANQELICVSRPEGASPAVGSAKLSNRQQKHIIEQSFNI